jgi:hypothetical protein
VAVSYVNSTTVDVEYDTVINDGASNFDNQFRVFTQTGHKAVSAASRRGASDPDNKFVRLTCASLTGYTYIDVTYGQTRRATALSNAVADSDGWAAPGFILRA